MKMRTVVGFLVVALVLMVSVALIHARYQVDDKDSEYDCDQFSTDPLCACESIIGDEDWCSGLKNPGGDDYQSWGTGCIEEGLCHAHTNCEDGSRVECDGEFKVQADEAGVRCYDTGSDPGTWDYCPSP